jgi:CDP-glucose 4,6-dehydratase
MVMQEAPRLGLDSALAERALGWRPLLDTPGAIAQTAAWYAAWRESGDVAQHASAALDHALAAATSRPACTR